MTHHAIIEEALCRPMNGQVSLYSEPYSSGTKSPNRNRPGGLASLDRNRPQTQSGSLFPRGSRFGSPDLSGAAGEIMSRSDFIRSAIERALKQDGEERLRIAHSAIRWNRVGDRTIARIQDPAATA